MGSVYHMVYPVVPKVPILKTFPSQEGDRGRMRWDRVRMIYADLKGCLPRPLQLGVRTTDAATTAAQPGALQGRRTRGDGDKQERAVSVLSGAGPHDF